MDPKSATGSLHVTHDEVLTFAKATGDASPLHVDVSYARCTPFGEPVAHGLLCLLKVLAEAPPLTGRTLAALQARFVGPVLPGQSYVWEVETAAPEGEDGAVSLSIRLVDGRRTLIEGEADFVRGELRAAPSKAARPKAATESAVTKFEELAVGAVHGGAYRPDWQALRSLGAELRLPDRGVGVEHLAVLGWSSHLAGMEAPGRAAMISGYEMTCGDSGGRKGFTGRAEITDIDERFRTVRLAGEVLVGRLEAHVRLRTVARREAVPPSADVLRSLLAEVVTGRQLSGRSAFVTGGSRGLGAALVQALAIAGCTVHAAFHHSRAEAESLVAALGRDGSRVRLHQGDVADERWCAETRKVIEAECGPVDLLFLNAGPAAQVWDLHTAAVPRAVDHVRRGVQLAQAPLAAFADGLAARGGRVVAISSAYVTVPHRGLSHYIAAKHAVEGLVRASAAEYPGTGVSIVRPPRLATTFADSVASAHDALPVEPVAAAIVRHAARCEPGSVEVVEDFAATGRLPTEIPDGGNGAMTPSGVLAVAGTFTTDPLRPVLAHWSDRLGLDLDVRLTPYNQVFQELLDPTSTFASNRRGCNLALVRLEDWPSGPDRRRTLDEFVTAAVEAAGRGSAALVVALCPASPAAQARSGPELDAAESHLRAALEGTAGLHLLGSADWSGVYPVAEHHDAAREEHAHIPYTPTACAALGTAVMRKIHSLLAPPFKVLVLDCDNTLWSGVCGEDGPLGVGMGPGRRRLQEWAVELHDRGVLLCLASKNEEEDVDAVFRQRPDMPLKPEHVAARRVNWDPKPKNLVALAQELGLGLGSMVFLDDNPVETAAVRAAHPEVLALTLPQNEADLPNFLDRVWAFDRDDVTAEDRQRTAMYRLGRRREALRHSSGTLAEFVAGLDLRIDTHEVREDELARVAQLTQRTNQFNLSTVRRSEPELRALLKEGARCWVAEVSDRFGDYGLVGAAVTRVDTEAVVLDSFLMSCRVLGRGVEHAFLAAVATAESGEGAPVTMEAVQRPTARNRPARLFFDSAMGPGTRHPESGDGAVIHRTPLEELARLVFRPDGVVESGDAHDATAPGSADPMRAESPLQLGAPERVAALTALATDLTDVQELHRAVNKVSVSAGQTRAGDGRTALDAVRDVLAGLLAVPSSELRHDTTLDSLRLESLQIVDATVALEERYGRLPRTLFFEHRTLGSLAAAVKPAPSDTVPALSSVRADIPLDRPTPPRPAETRPDDDSVAVVGIAGRYPGAEDITQLWRNLVEGADSVGDVSERWDRADVTDPNGGPDRTYSSAGGLIDGVDEFDSLFFNIAPSEAETIDPQQRIFLQVAYHALEDAGHTAASLGPAVGVYVASMGPDYALLNANAALAGLSRYPNSDLYQIANRVSYFLDLTGPSIAVDTACSGSGVALTLACDALRSGSATAAIAGGVNLILHPARRIQYAQLGMVSRSGRCRPFGAGADGMVTSEGVGAVVLRPLRAALADGDHIYGVIRSVGTNSGGRTNGFTVPSPEAQASLIGDTLRRADIDPATVGYVEAHGTGTPLGDPIEIRGLTKAFGASLPSMAIPIGSIKGNIGHTEATAAVAGLTKVMLQLKHRTLVPSLHAAELNPDIDFADTPFLVQQTAAEWKAGPHAGPRRAALSSFGAGGVNVHMVVEEAPSPDRTGVAPEADNHLVVLSAHDDAQLRLMTGRLASWLRGPGEYVPLADVAHTLRLGRAELSMRLAMTTGDRQKLLTTLDRLAEPGHPLADAARDVGVSHGRVGGDGGLGDVFDGTSSMAEVLRTMGGRGDLARLGRLWCEGAAVDWKDALPESGRRRVPLPGYPFRRTRHWLRTPPTTASSDPASPGITGAATYYVPEWATEPAVPPSTPEGFAVVVIGGDPAWSEAADRMVADVEDVLAIQDDGRHLVVVDRQGADVPRPSNERGAARETEALRTLARLADDGRRVTCVQLTRASQQDPLGAVVPGFGRALAQEVPGFRAVRVEIVEGTEEPDPARVLAEVAHGSTEVRFHGAHRQVRRWEPVPDQPGGRSVFVRGGHYLITGGSGGIAALLTVHLAERHGASVTLVGRSAPTTGTERLRERVRACGGDLLYLRADVTDASALVKALDSAREHHGPLRGVIHAAGVLLDGPARGRTDAETTAVLAPKVTGTTVLDAATADDELDFFLAMSSFVGTFGNAGQAAYCAGNRFLDAFAEHRAERVERGERHGRSISAVWPLWEEGGMEMPPAVRQLTATTVGLTAIATPAALRALEDVLRLGRPTVLIGWGDQQRIGSALKALEPTAAAVGRSTGPVLEATDPGADVRAQLCDRLRHEAADLAGIPYAQVDTASEFGDYGFNSMLFTDFANRLNEQFQLTLTPVVFYQAPTIDALVTELLSRYRNRVAESVPLSGAPAGSRATNGRTRSLLRHGRSEADGARSSAVAVIGMSGRFPGAADLDSYWAQLMAGRDMVSKASPGRFGDLRPMGGFLDDVLAFDARFFGISPREARLMDPQQRLFLEEAWHALEDAGYAPRALAGSRTGVFVGATLSDYTELLSRHAEPVAAHSVTGHVQSIIANRLSHVLDLHGPSEVLDTACSSSLTALHRALSALRAGECDLAVAGGVNVLFSPQWFASLEAAGMLSASGRCWTFDERADGFVRGEGVGVVVLKPLDTALRDGDDIRAVIRGSAVNHGGRAHSLTAPNPEAQADVIATALNRSGVTPRSVSYIETHGTGTKLGDPIEVAGLTQVFAGPDGVPDAPWCHLGAVKGNVGHLESAAGMAGLLKVLLALRHRTLPPNAVGERPNHHLDLAGGPFRVLMEAHAWRPVDDTGAQLPLRAGVSAFGFGGANAHVVVEEPPSRPHPEGDAGPHDQDGAEHLIVLSATDTDRLGEYVRRLRSSVARTGHSLADLSHTSRTARGALPVRLAAVASDGHQLLGQLDAYLSGDTAHGLYTGGDGKRSAPGTGAVHRDALAWVAGEPIVATADPARRRVAFPVYPFDHSTTYGPPLDGEDDMTPATASSADRAAYLPRLMARQWTSAPATTAPLDGRPLCLLLVGREAGVSFTEDLAGFDHVRWVVIREPSALPPLVPHQYEMEFGEYEAGLRIADDILSCHGPLHSVIDLADVSGAALPNCENGRVGLLQRLLADDRVGEPRLVHVRRPVGAGMRHQLPDAGVGGARFAALARAIGAEYGAVRTVTVEADDSVDGLESLLRLALREVVTAGEEPEIRFHNGVREVPRLTPIEVPPSGGTDRLGTFVITAQKPYVITGGTGGLGLAVAELLVERGARRLVLVGRRELPPRHRWTDAPPDAWWADRVAAIQRLESAGAEVLLHSGPLTDPAVVDSFLADVRGRFGRPAGVLHCAGSVAPTPAFVRKPLHEILACWEPKGAALVELDRALAEDEPDFVVLYSSLSAVIPSLAVGLSDYASANAALDAYAAYAARREIARGTRTRWLAIDWGSWAGAGMGEVTSPRYRELGLSALTRDQGLALLDSALSTTGHTSLVAVAARAGATDLLSATDGGRPAASATLAGEGLRASDDVSAHPGELRSSCASHITDVLAETLLLDRGRIRPDAAFADLGVDSILIAGIVSALEPLAGAPLEPSVVLEHPSVSRLADHLCERYSEGIARWARTTSDTPASASAVPPAAFPAVPPVGAPTGTAPTAMPLAVIGMAGRFPGAATTADFWDLLRQGRSGVREVPRSRWDVATLYSPEHRDGRSVSKWGGFLDGIEDFDAGYFGIPEKDAAHVDPLTRLFLEVAEETFADAGYRSDELAGRRVGVFVGSGTSSYGSRITVPHRATATGLNQNFIGAHLAHFRDLRGPNMVVDTACSSSLTSLHLARQALQLGECEMALVGGADLILDETAYLSLSASRALSPDGACRVFDAGANGFVPGEGAGAVLVKPLDRALSDGDRILAVIEATAMNNDGRTMGLTTPNPEAQQAVVRDALAKAGADAASVSYVEAHGTGTMIGDPIELKALTGVFGEFTTERGFCGVGSVKSNVGHLLMAAGMASLHKVVLSLVHRTLPPTLHCERPNPRFAFDASPFRLQTELGEWHPRHGIRRAGISAFGFGGTNCHAVVRELTQGESSAHTVTRAPLPAPVFRRRRHWVERPTGTSPQPAPRPRPLLQLEELI
ncbi:SDR family NAD(P)-dependent oxidoreductase [Streptomyces microflavus]|uniref:SDR family NAD(P)-dependent oxidoreductase n=2 Tax=Streptomyces microflavus TaxID=1919 RepID=UPI0033AC7B89